MTQKFVGRSGVEQVMPLSDRQREVARVLGEEGSEVALECSKLYRCGQGFKRTDEEDALTVRSRFNREIGDFLMLADEALAAGLIDRTIISAHIERKIRQLQAWTDTCGDLPDYPLARMLGNPQYGSIIAPPRVTTVGLYVDLDGTLFDFDGAFFRLFGVTPQSLSTEHKWGKILGVPRFFAELEAYPGAKEFMLRVAHLQPRILTGCPKTQYQRAAGQKIEASRREFGEHLEVLPVQGSRNKIYFMQRKGDIIVDDRPDVCDEWTRAGGYAILFKGCYETTYQLIMDHVSRHSVVAAG